MKAVSTGVRKKDAMSLVTGKPVYTRRPGPTQYPVSEAAAIPPRPGQHYLHRHQPGQNGARGGGGVHLGGHAQKPLHHRRPDLAGAQPPMTG